MPNNFSVRNLGDVIVHNFSENLGGKRVYIGLYLLISFFSPDLYIGMTIYMGNMFCQRLIYNIIYIYVYVLFSYTKGMQ